MQGLSTVSDVDQFCSSLYAGDKVATQVFTTTGWAGCLKEVGLPLMMRVIVESQSSQSIIFSCRALGECIDAVLKSEGPTGLTKIVQIAFDRLRGVDGALPSHPAQGALERLIAVAIRCGYRHSPDVANLPRALLKEGHTLLQGETASAGTTGAALRAVCAVLAALVVAVNEVDPLAITAKATEAVGTAARFRDEYLLDMYAFACSVVKRVGHSPALDSALLLLLSLMDYKINCTAHTSTDDDDSSWVCAEFPARWQSTVVDLALFQRLWVLYQLSGPSVPTLKSILELLRRYVGIKSGQYASAVECGKWVEVTLLQTHVVMESSLHLEEDDVRTLFAVVLNRIKPARKLEELTTAPSFNRWLSSSLRFSQACFAQRRLSDASVLSLLSMWSALGGAQSYVASPVEGLADALTLVVSAYMSAVTENISAFVDELTHHESGVESLDYVLEDDAEGVRLQLQFLVALAASSGREGTRALQQFAQSTFEQAPAAITRTPDTKMAIIAAERAAWLLRLAAVSISETALSSDPETSEVMAFFAILFLYRWTREPHALAHLPAPIRAHLEDAATSLSEAVGKVLLIPAYASSRKVAKGLAQRLAAAQVLASEDGFTAMWFDIVLERCWISLWASNASVSTRIAALQYVSQLAAGSSALRAMKGTKAYHRFVDLEPGHAPPCGTEPQWHRIRLLYARCVGRLRLSENVLIGSHGTEATTAASTAHPPTAAVNLRRLVAPILCVWDAVSPEPGTTVEGTDETALLASLCDARGLLFSATRRAFVGLVELFHSYLPRLTACILTSAHCQKPIAVQMLKLVAEMMLNRSQRAFFGDHSALGIQLVQHAQRAVEAASGILSAATRDISSEVDTTWLWKVLRATLDIGRNTLRGGYCNWAVLVLYDEATLDGLLNVLWALVSNVGLVDGVQHPKVLLSLLQLVNELLVPFFASFWESRQAAHAQYVLSLVEAVAFPSQLVPEAANTYAVGVLQRLVDLCTEQRAHTLTTETEASQCLRLRRLLVSLDTERLHRILTCSIESVLSTNGSMAPSLGSLLRAALLAEGDQLVVVANYYCARCPTPQAADACLQICRQIAQQASSLDVEGVKSTSEQLIDHLRTCL